MEDNVTNHPTRTSGNPGLKRQTQGARWALCKYMSDGQAWVPVVLGHVFYDRSQNETVM